MKANACNFLTGAMTLLLVCTAVWGQAVSTSQVSGVVQDQSGAVIADAQVQLAQTDTGLVRTSVTDQNGYYVIPNLPVGPYRMQVTKSGFNTYVQTGIVLQVSSNPVLNATLGVGAVSQEVTVQASAQMVETENNGVGQVIDQQRVVDLPLNGRQLPQLISLAGGATPAVAGDLNTNKNYPIPTGTISVSGGLPNGITYLLDGSTHNDPFNNLNLPLPFPDATQEFKVETSSLPAQYGDHAAAAVNAVTKSGTNSFHGDAFEFVRNFMFNAREADQAARDSLKRNQFGGVLGGPLKKDKLFFFAGYQGTIQKSNPLGTGFFVPTAAMKAGDFSAVTNPANKCPGYNGVVLRAPFGTGGAAPNTLPAGAINAQGLNFFDRLPSPSSPTDPCGSVTVPVGANLSETLAVGRVDYILTSKQTLYARYFVGDASQPVTSDGKDILEVVNKVAQYNRAQSLALGYSYTITPNLINSIHVTGLRSRNLRAVLPWFSPSDLGINDTTTGVDLVPHFMGAIISNNGAPLLIGIGATNPGHFNSTSYQFADDLDLIRGSHQITLGVDYIHAIMYTVNYRPANGVFTFSSGGPTASVTGLGYGDLLTGNLDALQYGNPDFENDGDNYIGMYIQDSWKATRRLTLNYGLRWEPYFPYHNLNQHAQLFSLQNFQALVPSTVFVNSPAGLIYPGDPGFPGDSYQSAKPDDIAPRLGVVWDPNGDGRMTIRAGYGIFYDTPQMFFDTRYSNNPPWGAQINLTGPGLSLTNPWTTYPGGVSPFPALNAVSKSMQFPTAGVYVTSPLKSQPMYLEQWNLTIQKQVGSSWLFSGSYIGNETKHLPTSFEGNPGFNIPGNCTAGGFFPAPYNNVPDGLTANGACSSGRNLANRRQLFLASPPPTSGTPSPAQNPGVFYSTIGTLDPTGNANYNAMLLSAQHRLTHNFSILANWTYSHCLSDAETTELTGPSYVIPGHRNLSYSNCDSDIRHTFNISFIGNSPKFSNRLLETVAGNWQFSTIITRRTGLYSSVTMGSNDIALSGITPQIAEQVSTNFYSAKKGSKTPGPFDVNWLNNAAASGVVGAWTTPVAGTGCTVTVNGGVYACSRPLTVEGPGLLGVDTSLERSFRIVENQSLVFRWEVFNLPNYVNLGTPNTSISSFKNPGTFGLITTAGSPRIMQFALKYIF
ncbi:MAG TPA: TonB-dependent receptor [Candidatus Acidoferrales bacterium]|nr:TonB-dependent receptor [Candidatus Acidoferrales bacterium]